MLSTAWVGPMALPQEEKVQWAINAHISGISIFSICKIMNFFLIKKGTINNRTNNIFKVK